MRKLKCIIIDDEEFAVKVIENHISQIEELDIVSVFYSGVEAFLALDQLDFDVLFLDIQMPKITGLSMIKMMKKRPLTILTTAHREFALEGFELDVVDYLLKPISFERFLKTIQKINRHIEHPGDHQHLPLNQPDQKDHLFIKVNRQYVKLFFEDILFVEAIKNHVRIVTRNETYISLVNISTFEQELPVPPCLRIHRSYIVNVHYLHSFNAHQVIINKKTIPIGRSYKDAIKSFLNEYLNPDL